LAQVKLAQSTTCFSEAIRSISETSLKTSQEMPSSMRVAASEGAALNWDVYKPVTKDGARDCDSTSAGSSDAEVSIASDETPQNLEAPYYANSAVAMVWLMGAMTYVHNSDETEQPAPKSYKPRRQRGRCNRATNCATSWATPQHPHSVPSTLPPGIAPPPGLGAPPGLSPPTTILAPPGLGPAPPPGLGAPTQAATRSSTSDIKQREEGPFEVKIFRKELVATLRELSALRNVARAVRRVRAQRVPEEQQAAEFADLLTRAAEEPRGAIRRLWWAFAAGLGAGVDAPDGSAFTTAACEAGMKTFFQDTYPDLCEEIHRLPVAAKAELIPTLRSVFKDQVMGAVLPTELR